MISAWFCAQGSSDIDAGNTLSMAFWGPSWVVPLVGWGAGKIDAARLAAVAALILAADYLLLTTLQLLPRLAVLMVGLGWGMFYLAAPIALSQRLTDAQRGTGFIRFSAFQMTGICGSPVLLMALVPALGLSVQHTFFVVSAPAC